MLLRRLLVLVVLLLVLLAVGNAIAPRESTRSTSPPPGPVTTPSSPPVAEPIPPAGPGTVELRLSAAKASARNVVRAQEGELVHLVVSGRVPGSVELSGYDLIEPVDAASPAEFDFFADHAGTFSVRLLESGAVVGRLRVKPTA